jgi:hypothetical protein
LDISENAGIMSLTQSGILSISTGSKNISNGAPTPLDIGKPQA